MKRLAIVTTHPIQYNAPAFAELAKQKDLCVRVFYGWRGAIENTLDPGFGQSFQWDVPLLEGYDYEFVENMSKQPGSHHFRGINLPGLKGKINAWNADSVLVYGWCYQSHLEIMRHFHGRLPVFFRGDSTMLNASYSIRSWLRSRLLNWVYRHVDTAFYCGSNNRDYFLAHGLDSTQLTFAPHAVDNRRFDIASASAEASEMRRTLGISEDDVVFLLPAKLEPVKAPHLLLDAFEQLQCSGESNSHLLFAGSGLLETSLKERRVPNTHFLGFQNQSQMPVVYRSADLVVLPSLSESWGLALNEAMASSRAVLASDRVGAAADLIKPGENGWIVVANDVNSLADALDSAIRKGRDSLHQYGKKSAQIISKWTIPIQASKIAKSVAELSS